MGKRNSKEYIGEEVNKRMEKKMIWSEEIEWNDGVVRECDYDQVKKVILEEIGGE